MGACHATSLFLWKNLETQPLVAARIFLCVSLAINNNQLIHRMSKVRLIAQPSASIARSCEQMGPTMSAGDDSVWTPNSSASLVAKQGTRIDTVDQSLCASQIVGLPRRKHQFDRIAQGIDERMDFGRQSSAGSADRLFATCTKRPRRTTDYPPPCRQHGLRGLAENP
jgi:hypothetical protein